MLAKICSRQQKQAEFSDEFYAGVLRVKMLFEVFQAGCHGMVKAISNLPVTQIKCFLPNFSSILHMVREEMCCLNKRI